MNGSRFEALVALDELFWKKNVTELALLVGMPSIVSFRVVCRKYLDEVDVDGLSSVLRRATKREFNPIATNNLAHTFLADRNVPWHVQ